MLHTIPTPSGCFVVNTVTLPNPGLCPSSTQLLQFGLCALPHHLTPVCPLPYLLGCFSLLTSFRDRLFLLYPCQNKSAPGLRFLDCSTLVHLWETGQPVLPAQPHPSSRYAWSWPEAGRSPRTSAVALLDWREAEGWRQQRGSLWAAERSHSPSRMFADQVLSHQWKVSRFGCLQRSLPLSPLLRVGHSEAVSTGSGG